MCEKSRGDATNWDEQTLMLLNLAKPHLISGALRGIFLGDELTASGVGAAPHDPTAVSFADIERWVDLTRGFVSTRASYPLPFACEHGVFFERLRVVAAG